MSVENQFKSNSGVQKSSSFSEEIRPGKDRKKQEKEASKDLLNISEEQKRKQPTLSFSHFRDSSPYYQSESRDVDLFVQSLRGMDIELMQEFTSERSSSSMNNNINNSKDNVTSSQTKQCLPSIRETSNQTFEPELNNDAVEPSVFDRFDDSSDNTISKVGKNDSLDAVLDPEERGKVFEERKQRHIDQVREKLTNHQASSAIQKWARKRERAINSSMRHVSQVPSKSIGEGAIRNVPSQKDISVSEHGTCVYEYPSRVLTSHRKYPHKYKASQNHDKFRVRRPGARRSRSENKYCFSMPSRNKGRFNPNQSQI
eukprot:gb/GECH01013284.1/.p1 GENE.gb/GECH01013284.1/~~gb/GECH01013284.1/.p1  ORF type:complete len:314 (+),score=46.50 gb/GECH01013284.1/:1-942(+)